MVVTDLENVNPSGRLDVVAYRGIEHATRYIEKQVGLNGIWDAIKPHVNDAVVRGLDGFEIPNEAKVLLKIIQSNYKHDIEA